MAPGGDDVAAAARGDRRAFERVYREHADRVFALCVRMLGDRVAAEEGRIAEDDALEQAPSRPEAVGDRLDLEGAIAALPRGARTVFVLHDVQGFTHEEIGEQLGISPGGSKAQLHRARMLLRAALTR